MKKFFVISAMVMGSMVVANATGFSTGMTEENVVKEQPAKPSHKSGKPSIYGTWKSSYGGETVTVVMTPKAMTITKVERDGDVKTEYFNSVHYNSATGKIKAHQYKEVEIEHGFKKVDTEGDYEKFYVTWIDSNHIQIGDHPHEMDNDFGTLTRM